MLTIVDLHREDELSPRSMAEAVGAWGDGVRGESQDDKHKDWIEVLAVRHPIVGLPVGLPVGQPIAPLSVA